MIVVAVVGVLLLLVMVIAAASSGGRKKQKRYVRKRTRSKSTSTPRGPIREASLGGLTYAEWCRQNPTASAKARKQRKSSHYSGRNK